MDQNIKRFVGLHLGNGKPWIESVSTRDKEEAREYMERKNDLLYILTLDEAESLGKRLINVIDLLRDLELQHHFVEKPKGARSYE